MTTICMREPACGSLQISRLKSTKNKSDLFQNVGHSDFNNCQKTSLSLSIIFKAILELLHSCSAFLVFLIYVEKFKKVYI